MKNADSIPESIKTLEEQINYCLRPFGIMHREVILDKRWYTRAFGPLIGTLKENGVTVALIPGMIRGYYFKNPITGKKIKLNSKTEKLFESEAICFYKPLPQKKLSIID